MPTTPKSKNVLGAAVAGKPTVTYKLVMEVGCACKSIPRQTKENLAVAICAECERVATTVTLVEADNLSAVYGDTEEMLKRAADVRARERL